jgi:hypothetical protein
MKYSKLLAAGTVVLAVMSGSASAFASTVDTSSAPSATDTSTTLPPKRDRVSAAEREAAAKFRADMLAWQVDFSKWIADRASAIKDHRDSLASASATLKTALAAASTKEARKAAMDAFKSAREAAKAALDAALAEIGERPVRPTR